MQLSLVADQRAINARRFDNSTGIDDELGYDAEAILIFEQRRFAGGKFFGKHGEIPNSGINRGGLLRGVLIDRGRLGNKCIHVGNADHDFHVTIRDTFGHFDLIEITRRVIVDGRPEQIAEIANVSVGSDLRRMGFQLGQLLRNLGENRLEAVTHMISLLWLADRDEKDWRLA